MTASGHERRYGCPRQPLACPVRPDSDDKSRGARCVEKGQLRTHAVQANEYAGMPYSITSSARATSVGGTVRPSALAVLRLIASSYLVGA